MIPKNDKIQQNESSHERPSIEPLLRVNDTWSNGERDSKQGIPTSEFQSRFLNDNPSTPSCLIHWIPLTGWVRNYRWSFAIQDLIAGMVLSTIIVPQVFI